MVSWPIPDSEEFFLLLSLYLILDGKEDRAFLLYRFKKCSHLNLSQEMS